MSIVSLFGQTSTYDYSSSYNYGNTYGTTSNVSPEVAAGVAAMMFLIMFIFVAISYVVTAFLLGRIFKKAGVEQWKAWVPIYNTWILLELGDQKGFWAILALVPFVNIVAVIFTVIAMYNIGLKLGKSSAFVLLAIFLPLIWLIWLAFDSSKWQGGQSLATASAPTSTGPAPTPPASNQTPGDSNSNQPTPPPAA